MNPIFHSFGAPSWILSVSAETAEQRKAWFGAALLGCAVNRNQAEGHRIALLPLEIVQKTPVQIAGHRDAVGDAITYAGQRGLYKCFAPAVV